MFANGKEFMDYLSKKGKLKEALFTYRRAVSLSPNDNELKLIYYDLAKDYIEKRENV